MKVLSAKNYSYLGTKNQWHLFVSKRKSFDPEVVMLYRARMIMEDGSSKFYDPIVSPATNMFNDQLVLSGTASNGEEYQLTLDVDSELETVVRVKSVV